MAATVDSALGLCIYLKGDTMQRGTCLIHSLVLLTMLTPDLPS